jgi:glyoxylase I family protein
MLHVFANGLTPDVGRNSPARTHDREPPQLKEHAMPMPANPPKNPTSPFASLGGHHVGVRVPDYEAAKAWYVEKLDFRVLQEWPYGDLKLAYLSPANDDDFHLELLAGPMPHLNPVLDDLGVSLEHGGYQHFCLHVDSVDAVHAELVARDVTMIGEPFEIDDISRRLAFFRDPWGNMIELSETLLGAGA